MSVSITVLLGVSLIGTVLSLVIRRYKPEYAPAIGIGTGIIILLMLMVDFREIFAFIEQLSSLGEVDIRYGDVIVRSLGVCLLTQLAGDTCRDCGESAIASKVELGGKIAVLVMSLPIFTSLLQTVGNLIKL